MVISPSYYHSREQLQEKKLYAEGKVTEEGKKLVHFFFREIDSTRYMRQAKEVLPPHHSLDELLYTLCLLLWHEQSVPARANIRNWAGQYQLHPSIVPIAAALYISEEKARGTNGAHAERTASYR